VVVGDRGLPIISGLDPYDVGEPSVSADGRFFAYQEATQTDAQNRSILTIHIVDLDSGRDIALPVNAIRLAGNSRGLRFSPDGSALVAYGVDTWPDASRKASAKMLVFATADGRLLSTIDVGDQSYNAVAPVGWTGAHTLAYTVNTTTRLGDFTNSPSMAHTLDVLTGERHDLPAGFGQLVAVLDAGPAHNP
jgi:hypothetical protein